VEGDAPGVTRELLSTLDQTRKLARIDFSGAGARPVGEPGAAAATMDHVLRVASVALANEQAGVTGAAVEMAVQYAKDRIQFGRPIGSFQAIKHKCADLHVALESARSAARASAVGAAAMSDDFPELAAIAASFCGEACRLAGHENIQIHGGIGFTWEHPAHLYYKRAKSSEFLFGDVQYHREILADIIGLERSTA
jgi:alkylation response protein AidB-like acyl-CoA dehydrogenase